MPLPWILITIVALSPGPAQSTKARGAVDRGKEDRRQARPGRVEAPPVAKKDKRLHAWPPAGTPVALDEGVSARLDAESTVYVNDGRWTDYPDGIYLEENENAVYGIASWPAQDLASGDTAALAAAAARVFNEYRSYADAACPVTLRRRIQQDESFRAVLAAEYERARHAWQERGARILTYEQFLEQSPDCDVVGNLWRTAIRFTAHRADRQQARLLVRFPDSVAIRPFLGAVRSQNHLSLLKDYLRRQNRLIQAPLQARAPEL